MAAPCGYLYRQIQVNEMARDRRSGVIVQEKYSTTSHVRESVVPIDLSFIYMFKYSFN
jgi:hypothetical protein